MAKSHKKSFVAHIEQRRNGRYTRSQQRVRLSDHPIFRQLPGEQVPADLRVMRRLPAVLKANMPDSQFRVIRLTKDE